MDFNLFEILFEILINVTCLGLILFVLMLIVSILEVMINNFIESLNKHKARIDKKKEKEND